MPNEEPEEKTLGKFRVVGRPGNTGYYGVAETGEYVQALRFPNGPKIFDQMRRSDPQVAMMLRLITNPITSTKFYIEPASKSPLDTEIAGVIEKAILKDLEFHRIIRHVCLMFAFGFSPIEVTWAFRNGYALPVAMDPRLPWTITRWHTDLAGSLIHIEQQDTNGAVFEIPAEKVMLFTTDREGDNWEGVSILRAAYKPWRIKSELEKTDAIKHDRYGAGIPTMKAPEGAKPEDANWKQSEKVLKNIRANETGGIVVPNGWELSILTPGSNAGSDALPSIRYHDEQIAKCILAMFASLGTTSGGNRALGEVLLSQFLDSEQSYADYIAGEFQRVVNKIVEYNWKGANPPEFKAGRVSKVDQDAIRALAAAGLITKDLEIENYIREALNLPKLSAGVKDQAGSMDNPGQVKQVQASHAPGCGCHEHGGKKLSEAWKKKQEKETEFASRFFDPMQYGMQLASSEQSLTKKLDDMRRVQSVAIKHQYVGGKRPDQITAPMKKEMFDTCMKEYEHQSEIGADQVRREISKQGKAPVQMAKKTLKYIDEVDAQYISLKIEGATSKLANMIGEDYYDLKKRNLKGVDLDRALDEYIETVSRKTWEAISQAVIGRGYGAGREGQAQDLKDVVKLAHYSTVLEDGSGIPCDVCQATYDAQTIDQNTGELAHDPGDPFFMAPNPRCEGWADRCRCINIYILGD